MGGIIMPPMNLFTYSLMYDDGAAPNPFWGVCTLALRKPDLRLAAQPDDWVVGLGTTTSLLGDISDHVVYAMKVTSKLTLQEYDQFCKTFLQKKLPDWRSMDYRHRMGDCIYNYVAGPEPKMRASIHKEENKEQDLRGKYALLSKQFYYFGNKPVQLPEELRPIIFTSKGFACESNAPYVEGFVRWIENLDMRPNKALGEPQMKEEYLRSKELQSLCSMRDLED
jgi:hypothetical protein